jgi:hypothetical protein
MFWLLTHFHLTAPHIIVQNVPAPTEDKIDEQRTGSMKN